MLIDLDVLVWLTRGHVGAAQRLQAIEALRKAEELVSVKELWCSEQR